MHRACLSATPTLQGHGWRLAEGDGYLDTSVVLGEAEGRCHLSLWGEWGWVKAGKPSQRPEEISIGDSASEKGGHPGPTNPNSGASGDPHTNLFSWKCSVLSSHKCVSGAFPGPGLPMCVPRC